MTTDALNAPGLGIEESPLPLPQITRVLFVFFLLPIDCYYYPTRAEHRLALTGKGDSPK